MATSTPISIPATNSTSPRVESSSIFAIALLVTLLKRGAVLLLVLVARSVAAVVVVIAFTVALGPARIVRRAIARVVAAGVVAIAVAGLRGGRPDDARAAGKSA